jgi:uncharacterized membrane protein YgcG
VVIKQSAWRLVAAAAYSLLLSFDAAGQVPRIQFAEPITLEARAGHGEFDAYGRRFQLELETNQRLLANMPVARKTALARANLMRGRLTGVPGSWVRLARVGDGLEGAIWDGADLYAITTRARIDESLTAPLAVGPEQTVVYRLSDVIGGPTADFCALTPANATSLAGGTPLQKYRALVDDLRVHAMSAAATDQVEISLIGDLEFQADHGADSNDELLARINIVDGIFGDQVGIVILATDVRLLTAGTDPFTTDAPEALLQELSTYRENTPAVLARGIAHLVTGRDLTGSTNGIAYLSSVCDARRGVSLSDNSWGTLTAAQIMAHELGHNLGAGHDGEPGSVCASTPSNYLMSPTVNGSGTFSACSVSSMSTVIAAARGRCIGPSAYADVSVEASTPVTADVGASFTLPFVVRSTGVIAAQQTTFTATLPAALTYESGTATGGSCAAGAGGTVTCTIGTLAPGARSDIALNLRGSQTQATPFSVPARVGADNDFLRGDNAASAVVNIRSAVDVGVTVTASAGTAYVTDTVDFTITLSSNRSRTAQGARLDMSVIGADLLSITAGANVCTVTLGSSFRCDIVDLAPGASTTITARARARTEGEWTHTAFVTTPGDGDDANNNATVRTRFQSERGVAMTQTTVDFRPILGNVYENTYTLTALGRLDTADVRLHLDTLRNGTIESFIPSAGSCINSGAAHPGVLYRCSFGTLSPGDVRTVVVRFRMTSGGLDSLATQLLYSNGTQDISWHVTAGIRAAPDVDLAISAGVPTPVPDSVLGIAHVQFESLGINQARNAVVTVDVPAAVQITNVEFLNWTCTRPTPQQARCTRAQIPDSGATYLTYYFRGATPGDYQARARVTADRDDVTANDSSDVILRIVPFVDVGISAPPARQLVIAGTLKEVVTSVTSGSRPVTAVRVTAAHSRPSWEIASMTAGNASCRAESFGFSCDLGDLPANASVPVTVRFNALIAGRSGGTAVCTSMPDDSNPANNCVDVGIDTFAPTDLRLEIAAATASGPSGGTVRMPLISLVNGPQFAADVRVQVPIPAFATVRTVASSGANCTGTTVLDCDFQLLLPNEIATLDITLDATGSGTFASEVRVTAANDSTAGNNAASVNVQVTAAGGGSSSGGASGSGGGGKGGGGGRLEWLGLAILAWLAGRRCGTGSCDPAPALSL